MFVRRSGNTTDGWHWRQNKIRVQHRLVRGELDRVVRGFGGRHLGFIGRYKRV